jgi:hypothetical protein
VTSSEPLVKDPLSSPCSVERLLPRILWCALSVRERNRRVFLFTRGGGEGGSMDLVVCVEDWG